MLTEVGIVKQYRFLLIPNGLSLCLNGNPIANLSLFRELKSIPYIWVTVKITQYGKQLEGVPVVSLSMFTECLAATGQTDKHV